MKTLYCRWFGCELPPSWTEDQSCARCGGYVEYGDTVGDTPHGRLKDRLDSIRRFFSACPDCGKRFNRHDDAVDHILF